jgi:hypothetical protein
MARAPGRIGEADLTCPTLQILASHPGGECTTTQLIKALETHFQPQGEDAEILDNRSDSRFSQIVRNMKSHKDASTNIIGRGLVIEIDDGFRITPAGVNYLQDNCH